MQHLPPSLALISLSFSAFVASCGIEPTGALVGQNIPPGMQGSGGQGGENGSGGALSSGGAGGIMSGTGGSTNGSGGAGGGMGGAGNGGAGGNPGPVCGNGVVDAPDEECDDAIDASCTGCKLCQGVGEFIDVSTAHCYRWVDGSLNWDDARADCMSWGGDLAGISTKAEFDFLAAHQNPSIAKDTWVGGYAITPMCSYKWVNGEPWRSQWADNEPSTDTYFCLHMWASQGKKLDDIKCDTTQSYLCERAPKGVCGDGKQDVGEACDDGNTLGGDGCSPLCQVDKACAAIPGSFTDAAASHCYWLHTDKKNWADAKNTCELEGGYLVVIDSAAENELVRQKASPETYIGAWEGNSNADKVIWEQPSMDCGYKNFENSGLANNEDCLRMIQSSGQWRDATCSIAFDFMCERNY